VDWIRGFLVLRIYMCFWHRPQGPGALLSSLGLALGIQTLLLLNDDTVISLVLLLSSIILALPKAALPSQGTLSSKNEYDFENRTNQIRSAEQHSRNFPR